VILPGHGPIVILCQGQFQRAEHPLKSLAYLVQDRQDKCVLVLEIVVDASLAQTGFFDNPVIRRRVKTALRELLYRRLDQPLAFGVVQSLLSDDKNHLAFHVYIAYHIVRPLGQTK
jgi:hypothetical protein